MDISSISTIPNRIVGALNSVAQDGQSAQLSRLRSAPPVSFSGNSDSTPALNGTNTADATNGANNGANNGENNGELREAFNQFVGQTFFGQLLASLRSTTQGAAYFDGGRAEEIFRGQLDQVLAERMTEASGDQLAGPMFDLFMLPRP